MAKGNTAVKKLMAIARREMMKRVLGTAKRFRDDMVNHAVVSVQVPTTRRAVRTLSPVRADYVRHAGKWKHYR